MRVPLIPFRTRSDWVARAPGVARHLLAGGLIAYPTETVYGLGCALRQDALERLTALKGRVRGKPFLLLVTGTAQAHGLEWTEEARTLAARFWPGPLTLVLGADPGRYPQGVVSAAGGVAVRATSHQGMQAILHALGGPITSTSANRPRTPPAASASAAHAVLEALGGGTGVWLLDGGRLPPSPPSTIVDCSGGRPRLLRAGAIGAAELEKVVGAWHE
ncbi:MAG: threonylcarbamoyl-AMP synthase [Gemmatimonadetes bacterium]|nr:threonylcarbamoyl-AMP synthase [Gemmatimonadota bacterium]